jgi:TPR repeat protein
MATRSLLCGWPRRLWSLYRRGANRAGAGRLRLARERDCSVEIVRPDETNKLQALRAGDSKTIAVLQLSGTCLVDVEEATRALREKSCELGATHIVVDSETYGLPYICAQVRARALFVREGSKLECETGSPQSCTLMGRALESGTGVTKDEAEAARFYDRGCNRGDPMACTYLGHMHASGRGLPKDPARAVPLYQKACDNGHAAACTDLGLAYISGNGVPKDEPRAVALLQKYCDSFLELKGNPIATFAGDPAACTALGILHRAGEAGVSKDTKRATKLLTAGCQGGDAFACKELKVTR